MVYTGPDTKISLNEGKYSIKISDLTIKVNWYMIVNICIFLSIVFLMSQAGNRLSTEQISLTHYYIFPDSEQPVDNSK